MKSHINDEPPIRLTDWRQHNITCKVGEQEYSIAATVFLEKHRNGTEVVVEGWESIPPREDGNHPHYSRLDAIVREECEEEFCDAL